MRVEGLNPLITQVCLVLQKGMRMVYREQEKSDESLITM